MMLRVRLLSTLAPIACLTACAMACLHGAPLYAQDATGLLIFGPIDGPTTIPTDVLKGAEAVFKTTLTAEQSLHVTRVAPPAPDALSPYGADKVNRCPSNPRDVDELRESTKRGMGLVDELEYEAASRALESSYRDLPCASGFLNREELTNLSMTLGVLAYYQGRRDEAAGWFKQTLAVNPTLAWDNAYPPDAQQIYMNALAEVMQRSDANLLLEEGQTAVSEVRIDGSTYDPIAGVAKLKPGEHLVQWRTVDGRIQSVSVVATSGKQVVLLSPGGLHRSVLAGERSGVGKAAVVERLTALAQARQVGKIYVWGEGVAYIFDPGSGAFQNFEGGTAVSQGRTATVKPKGKPSVAGPVMIGLGGGLGAAGAVLSGLAFSQGQTASDQYEETKDLQYKDQYDGYVTQNRVGYVVAGVGGAALVSGIVLSITNPPPKKGEKAAMGIDLGDGRSLQILGAPTGDGGWVGINVAF